MTPPETISQRDAADRLGISRATVERWINQGRLNTIRTGARGGARRVLVDDTFLTANDSSRKIPHITRPRDTKSLTGENPSRVSTGGIPHASADPKAAGYRESLTTPASDAVPAEAAQRDATESLTADPAKSITEKLAAESLSDAELMGIVAAPPPTHERDADLVSLTYDAGERPAAPLPYRTPAAQRGTRALVSVVLLALVGVAGIATYESTQPTTQSPPITLSAPLARGGKAQRLSEPIAPKPLRVQPARGGVAQGVVRTAPTHPAARQPTTSPARPTPAPAQRTHVVHPITPCQSAGICVAD